MKIYVIRHGQTDWNQTMKWQGHTDIKLNETGEKQALLLAERIRHSDFGINKIYSSPLIRAYKTAEIISKINAIPIETETDLKEVNLGQWEGKTLDEILLTHEKEFYSWDLELSPRLTVEAETILALRNRAMGALSNIVHNEKDCGNIAVVTHGAWIRALITTILNIDLQHKMLFEISNASLSILTYNGENDTFWLNSLNDVSHLQFGHSLRRV